jgi:hypothetical protein
MRTLLQKLEETFADAALLEMGVKLHHSPSATKHSVTELLEEEFVEIAFAEESDYEEIHQTIMREHEYLDDRIHPDDCQYGDNDICFVH